MWAGMMEQNGQPTRAPGVTRRAIGFFGFIINELGCG